ncbi:MAG: hypothetical protein B5M56_05690 [Desulfococcus sp. 4484_241]|nr:MAG: hypothetical protein B5M56_05690 [Desulfococcus sp. 4484_241]
MSGKLFPAILSIFLAEIFSQNIRVTGCPGKDDTGSKIQLPAARPKSGTPHFDIHMLPAYNRQNDH